MLKYQNLLNQLSLEEKIKLITSNERIKNNQIENYEFPSIDYIDNMKDIVEGIITPSINSLGSVYDKDLIEEYGYEIGKYLSSINYKKIINIPIGPIMNNDSVAFSSSRLVSARIGASLARGIEKGGHLASYGVLPGLEGIDLDSYFNDVLYSYKVAFSDYKPFSCLLSSSDSLDTVNDDYQYDGLKVVFAKDSVDLANSINHHSTLSITDDLNIVDKIKTAVLNYENIKIKLSKGEITNDVFTNCIKTGEAINPYTIDEVLDSLFTHLAEYQKLTNQNVEFDSKRLNELEYRLSQASVVLLKNDNNILPFKRENKVSFIGDQLFNPKFNTDNDVEVNILNIIDNYHLETCGIAHGYIKGKELNEDVVNKSIELIKSSEYSFIFLDTEDHKIPDEELAYLERIKNIEGVNIIPVLYTNTFVDIRPLLDFKAIVLNMGDSKSMINATLDVITGRYNPTGRLPFALKSNPDDVKFKSNVDLIYPLGYGLSYSKFDYTSITIDNGGIILAVTNKSNLAGTDMLLFANEYLNSDHKENNIIRDFITLDLEPHESKIVEFKFNFNSFSAYVTELYETIIRAGEYNVQLLTDFNNVLSEKKITLKELHSKEVTSVELDKSYDNLDESLMDFASDVKTRKLISTKAKVWTLTLISIYFYAVLIIWFIYNNNSIVKAILLALVGLLAIFDLVMYIILYRRSKNSNNSKYESLKNVINSVSNFNEFSHETYKEPIPEVDEEEEEIIEEIEEEIVEEPIVEEVKVQYYYDEHGELITDENQYSNDSELDEIVEDFINYALNNGLIIENMAAKELFSALLSSNFVLVNNKTDELNVRLLDVLNKYLGNTNDIFVNLDGVSNPTEIYWNQDMDGNYIISDFTNNLIRGNHLNNRINIFAFRHVSLSQLETILPDYLDFAKAHKIPHKIDIGDNHEITIPANTVFFGLIDDPNYLEGIDKTLSDLTVSIELITRVNEIESEAVNVKYNSIQYYEFLLRNAKEVNYLNEDLWKKMDDFCESSIFDDFYIDSRSLNICERIVAVMLSCGADQNDALNSMFKMRVIPMLKRTKAYKENHGDKVIIELIEKIFEDRLDNAIKYLKKPE